jgi:hypothetical protein
MIRNPNTHACKKREGGDGRGEKGGKGAIAGYSIPTHAFVGRIREIKTVEKGKKELEWSIHGDEDVNKELEASAKLLVDKIDVVNGQRMKLRSEMEAHQVSCRSNSQRQHSFSQYWTPPSPPPPLIHYKPHGAAVGGRGG